MSMSVSVNLYASMYDCSCGSGDIVCVFIVRPYVNCVCREWKSAEMKKFRGDECRKA